MTNFRQIDILKKDDSGDGDSITVWGVVYPSLKKDTQQDAADVSDVRKACHLWMSKGIVRNIDIYHERKKIDAVVVENFFTRKGDPDFPPDQWVAGVQINDADVCAMVRKGELNGFSLDGEALSETGIAKVTHPVKSVGATELSLDDDPFPPHTHDLEIEWDADANVITTKTAVAFGHTHDVIGTTATEISVDHAHRVVID